MTPEEIVKRLRSKDRTRVIYNRAGRPANFKDENDPDCMEAADLIEQQAKALEEAEKALDPIAKEANRYDPDSGDGKLPIWDTPRITIADLRRARSALATIRALKGK